MDKTSYFTILKNYLNKIDGIQDVSLLRVVLLEIEGNIKNIIGKDPMRFSQDWSEYQKLEEIKGYLAVRSIILDRMFIYSPEEVERIAQANSLLTDLRRGMFKRTVGLYRNLLTTGIDSSFDDDYIIEGKLTLGVDYDPEEGDYGTVLHLDNDEYYGSDFPYMLGTIRYMGEEFRCSMSYIDECHVNHSKGNTPEMSDAELNCDYTDLDDGLNWAESVWHDSLQHICFGHCFYALHNYHHISYADIIRINRYNVDVTLTCQRITDHAGHRYDEIEAQE